jgi:hypothetical protein
VPAISSMISESPERISWSVTISPFSVSTAPPDARRRGAGALGWRG